MLKNLLYSNLNKMVMALAIVTVSAAAFADFTPTKIDWSGRMRYRHETGNYKLYSSSKYYDRERQRMYLELSMKANLNEEVMFGGMIGTGTDPKNIDVDFENNAPFAVSVRRIYLGYSPLAAKGLTVNAGAIPVPFTLVGGSDLIFELVSMQGAAAIYETNWGDLKLRPVLGQFVLKQRTEDSTDAKILPAAQLDASYTAGTMTYQLGSSLYQMSGVAGYSADKASSDAIAGGKFGNSVDGSTKYVNNYHLLNHYASVSADIGEAKVQLYVDYVRNMTADEDNKATLVGLKLKQGLWDFALSTRRVEKDAVLGALSWGDPEGTGYDSNYFHVGYKISSNLDLRGAYIMHKSIAQAATGENDTVNKLKLDIRASF